MFSFPRSTISANSSAVKTLLMEPISKKVWALGFSSPSRDVRPKPAKLRPSAVSVPTTMPTP
jgi:hypothetical protein